MTDLKSSAPADPLIAAKIVYGLFALGFLVPVLAPLAAVILAYISRGKDDMLDTHVDFQIKTFWISLALSVAIFATSVTLIGLGAAVPLAIFTTVWVLARSISGGMVAFKCEPIQSVGAFGFIAR